MEHTGLLLYLSSNDREWFVRKVTTMLNTRFWYHSVWHGSKSALQAPLSSFWFWYHSVWHGSKSNYITITSVKQFWYHSVWHGSKSTAICALSSSLFWYHSVWHGSKRRERDIDLGGLIVLVSLYSISFHMFNIKLKEKSSSNRKTILIRFNATWAFSKSFFFTKRRESNVCIHTKIKP